MLPAQTVLIFLMKHSALVAQSLPHVLATCGEMLGSLLGSCQHQSSISYYRGPLVCADQLTGVVSWGIGCGEGSYPWVNTEVAFHKEWILKTMAN